MYSRLSGHRGYKQGPPRLPAERWDESLMTQQTWGAFQPTHRGVVLVRIPRLSCPLSFFHAAPQQQALSITLQHLFCVKSLDIAM